MIRLFILVSLISVAATAQKMTVQRALNSSYSEYSVYLRNSQKLSFAESYTSLNLKREVSSTSVEECLLDLIQESKDSPLCDKAIFELTRRPLNRMSTEVLISLLSRIGKSSIKEKQFFNSFLNSLLATLPDVKKSMGISKRTDVLVVNSVSKLEYQAWMRMILKKVSAKETLLMVNGIKVPSLNGFQPPQGVFQWSLVTNSFEPLNFVGTWHQFASRSSKELKPFFIGDCDRLKGTELPESEILGIEVFLNENCVHQSQNVFQTKYGPDHLDDLSGKSSMSIQKNAWVWPSVFVAVGAGVLASSLRNKKVKVEMPGFN